MYKIPITNSPNQTFNCNIPINGENQLLKFRLWYSYVSKYWSMTIIRVSDNVELLSNLPLLCSKEKFANIFCQFGYLRIGVALIVPMNDESGSMPNDSNLGSSFVLIWGDNNEL